MSTRPRVISELKRETDSESDNELMDYLQGKGWVSDEAVWLTDVPDSDLVAAVAKLRRAKR